MVCDQDIEQGADYEGAQVEICYDREGGFRQARLPFLRRSLLHLSGYRELVYAQHIFPFAECARLPLLCDCLGQ